jgi:hypothetical protein
MTLPAWLRRWTLATTLGALALGCSSELAGSLFAGREVSLGEASPGVVDLSACHGPACAAGVVTVLPLDETAPRDCIPEPAPSLAITWSESLTDEDFRPIPRGDCADIVDCVLWPAAMAVATDGSLWVAANVTTASFVNHIAGVWLAHHGPRGERLSSGVVDLERLLPGELVDYVITLAPGSSGEVLLGLVKRVAKEGFTEPERSESLRAFDATGQPASEPTWLTGEARSDSRGLLMAPAGGGALAISRGNRVAILNSKRSVRWAQTRTVSATDLTSDPHGRVTVFTGYDGDSDVGTLERYSSEGRLEWIRAPTQLLREAAMTSDANGDLLRVGLPNDDPLFWSLPITRLLVHKLSPEGMSVWLTQISASGETFDWYEYAQTPQVPVALDAAGQVWHMGPRRLVETVGGAVEDWRPTYSVYRVSADGSRCWEHELTGLQSSPLLTAGVDGLYFLSHEAYGALRVAQ